MKEVVSKLKEMTRELREETDALSTQSKVFRLNQDNINSIAGTLRTIEPHLKSATEECRRDPDQYAHDTLIDEREMIEMKLAELVAGTKKSVVIVIDFECVDGILAITTANLLRTELEGAGFQMIYHFNDDYSSAYLTVFQRSSADTIKVERVKTHILNLHKTTSSEGGVTYRASK